MGTTAIISFILFTALAATISYFKTRKTQRSTISGFLFANRTNGFIIIGASLFFSNISANQFIGENESVYINNMSVIGWGISSILAMIIVSEFFIPIYFKTGIRTIPDFWRNVMINRPKPWYRLFFFLVISSIYFHRYCMEGQLPLVT